MKTILVPIDFSQNAENALRYAIMLSDKWQAKLILFHSFYTYHASGYSSASGGSSGEEAGHRVAVQELTELYTRLAPDSIREVEYLSSRSEMLEQVLRIVQEKHVDLIVMGTQGIGRLAGKFLGTNASRVVAYTSCPVIVVPESLAVYSLRHMAYASNYQPGDIPTLKTVAAMADAFGAELSVVHVTPYETTEEKHAFMLFEQKVRNEITEPDISFKTLPGSDVEDTLVSYLRQKEADLLVMSARQRDLFDKIFGKSITQLMTLHLQAPIMVFHHKKLNK